MSLIESAQHGAPLASEEKSLDKLEIELEEQEHMIKDAEADKKTQQQQQSESTDKPKKDEEGKTTARKALLNIKIPQILRKRSKERPAEKEKSKNEDDKAEKELLNGHEEEEEHTVKGDDGKPGGEKEEETEKKEGDDEAATDEKKSNKNEEEKKSEVAAPTAAETDSSFVTSKEVLEKDRPSETSFLASFSTPKWPNFRRVFSFNRSTPLNMNVSGKEESRVESAEQQPAAGGTVTLEIPEPPEEATKEDGSTKTEKVNSSGNGNESKNGKLHASPRKPATATTDGNNTFLSPLIKLFRPKTAKGLKEKDVESGEVATELLDKNNKPPEFNNGVSKTDQKSPAAMQQQDEIDGETKISPKHENKPSEETETMVSDVKSAGSENSKEKGKGGEMPLKPTPDLWRQRIGRFPALSKWILAAVTAFLALLIIIITITAFRASRGIDIAPLIIDGKYINTITSCGPIQGLVEDGAYAFRGIPYALPPVGELRWRQARNHHHLHHCWNGTFLAHNHSTPCWQFYRNGSYDGAEDCLYLNVFTPKVYYDTPLPVVVYVGGESLGGGESSCLQPTAALARAKNVVFVSVSIRRSVLGFLALDVLSRNSYPMSSGNYGLSDLLAALKWVHYNVEHFGGDRNHVTLLGHQSGGTLVSALMSSHLPKNLFHQVWVTGGAPTSSLISFQDAEIQNAVYMREVGCPSVDHNTTIDCMYSKTPEELVEAVPYDWRAFHQDLPTKNEKKHHWLVRDGLILRDSPWSNTHVQIEVPFVAGAPAEIDASYEMFYYLDWNDTRKFSDYLESKLGSFGTSLSREVSDRYFRPETTPWQQFASLLSDVRTICPLYYSTTFLANQFQKSRAYFYVVTQRKPSSIGTVADANADISAILGVYKPETREERLYVKNMERLFYGFVETGRFPDDHDVTKSIYLIDEQIQKIFTYPNCDFWHQHNFYPNYSRID